MLRPLVAYFLVAVVVAPAWLQLERGEFPLTDATLILLLGLLPTIAVGLRRSRLVVAAALAAAALVGASLAFAVPLADMRPGERDFWGPVFDSFRDGFLQFWDTKVPYDPAQFPEMHGVVLPAVLGFVSAAGMALAARRTFAALAFFLVGAGWPATMATTSAGGGRPLLVGGFILGVSLLVLVLMREGTRGLAHAGVVGAVLVAVAVGASTTDAVAKGGFVDWSSWDIYDKPDDPVDVRYVWDSNYDGISFPEKQTTVLRVKTASRRSLYWRATTLDEYTGEVWRENRRTAAIGRGNERIDVAATDPYLADAAVDEKDWVRQDVTVEALRDNRYVGSAQVVRWQPQTGGLVELATNDALVKDSALDRGERYTVWSYVPSAKPRQLNAAGSDYPAELERYLQAQNSADLAPLPSFGEPGRDSYMEGFFQHEVYLDDHKVMWERAKEMTADARTPYQAAVALESWFRGKEGGFVYDENPPVAGVRSPLPFFLETKRGYCQHYAGAMALMLRFLGVPARVAAGFTSGTYDTRKKEWNVTDHNAHTWVEVYFPRFGWIPFDPTPNRGQLSAQYSPFSPAFDAAEAAAIGGGFGNIPEVRDRIDRASSLEQRESGARSSGGGGAAGEVAQKGGSVLGVLLLVLAGAAAALVVLKEARRRIRFTTRDARGLAGACRRDLADYLADQGVEVPPSATPRELGELAERRFGVDATPFVGALAAARYGRPDDALSLARRARRELGRLRGRIRSQLGLGRRVRGALSLRSLGA